MNKGFRNETKYLGRMRACVNHNKTPQAVRLIDNRNFFLTVGDTGSPRSGAQHGGVLGALSWVAEAAFLFSRTAERASQLSGFFFEGYQSHSCGLHPLELITAQRPHLHRTITRGVRSQHRSLGDTNTPSVTEHSSVSGEVCSWDAPPPPTVLTRPRSGKQQLCFLANVGKPSTRRASWGARGFSMGSVQLYEGHLTGPEALV